MAPDTAHSGQNELATAIRAEDYADRKHVIRESNNHQRTVLTLALGAFGVLLGLLLNHETRGDTTRLFLLLALTEVVAIVGSRFTLGSAQTIDDAAKYVADLEESAGVSGWELRLSARTGAAARPRSRVRPRQIFRLTFGRELAGIYLMIGIAVPVYLRFDIQGHGALTIAQAIILWLLEVPIVTSCARLAWRY